MQKIQHLTINLLTTTIVAPPSNASKWQMGFNSTFKGLITIIQIKKCFTSTKATNYTWLTAVRKSYFILMFGSLSKTNFVHILLHHTV
jgi:hypothetical protein